MYPQTPQLRALLDRQPVIPVLRIDDSAHAVPLARALATGGLRVIEVTLRTAGALDAIERVAQEVPETIVGAGTILNARQCRQAADAGARFVVSPGAGEAIIDAARERSVPLLPGAMTPGEMMALLEQGFDFLKFFPAEQSGGTAFLRALASPFQGLTFCPTGGISLRNAPDYLSLPNVTCVGGSWVAPDDLVTAGEWQRIEALARDAASLGGGIHAQHRL